MNKRSYCRHLFTRSKWDGVYDSGIYHSLSYRTIFSKPSSHLLKICSLIIALITVVVGCAGTNYLKNKKSEELENIWLTSLPSTRRHIVQALEERKAVDSLKRCLVLSGAGTSGRRNYYTVNDIKVLVESLGRLKDPSSLDVIMFVNDQGNKDLKLAILKAYNEIGQLRSDSQVVNYLKDMDQNIRWQALDVIEHIGSMDNLELIGAWLVLWLLHPSLLLFCLLPYHHHNAQILPLPVQAVDTV